MVSFFGAFLALFWNFGGFFELSGISPVSLQSGISPVSKHSGTSPIS